MKLSLKPQNPLEWFALQANMVPVPIAHSQMLFTLSRAVICASTLELFEPFKQAELSINELAAQKKLNPKALQSLINVLTSAGYFKYKAGKYALTKMARKWCLKDSPQSTHNLQVYNAVCWNWMSHMDEFMQTGKGMQYHDTFTPNEWNLYQKGMESVATATAKEAIKMLPKLSNPKQMLDIGGSHGIYSVELCRKYSTLQSTILDLPAAVEKAAPILAKYNMGERVVHRAGNALTGNLGKGIFDVVFISSLIHHFTAEQCNVLMKKVAEALKPGGYCVIQEFLRPEPSNNMEMTGAILDLFFNLSSTAGNWSLDEIKGFETSAGLSFYKVNKFLSPPGFVQVIGKK